jgi:pteridine reductase
MTWALVTGASGRGGAAIATALHQRGQNVVLHHTPRSAPAAMAVAAGLEGARPGSTALWSADFMAPDLALPDAVLSLGISALVCNASVYEPGGVEDRDRALADWQVHVLANQVILSALRATLRSVVAVTDVHVERPAPGHVWYTASKAALQALMLALAVEWAPVVRCNVVQPGTLPYPDGWWDAPRARRIAETIPLQRIGRFDELAEAVAWLLLDSTYVTGQVLAVDGGRSRWLV